jgi:DNA-binding GntR family transcriptional regulator
MQGKYRFGKISDVQLLKDKVYEVIKKSIIELSLSPNDQLVEQRLAEELGVSKSPIREALMRLEQDGLVYTVPFKGCFVTEISLKNINEIFQLREALERFSVKFLSENYSQSGLQGAKKILEEAENALRRGDVKRCFEANTKFHDFLLTATKNERIIQAYSTLRNHLDRYRNIASLILGRVAKSHQEHLLIVAAIEKKDGNRAEKRMSEHLCSVLEDFLHSKELQTFTDK